MISSSLFLNTWARGRFVNIKSSNILINVNIKQFEISTNEAAINLRLVVKNVRYNLIPNGKFIAIKIVVHQ